MENINIEREARGGFANKEIGEIDFFLYKNEDHRYIQLAFGENKVWGSFENQVKQLLGYANRNINFGFTIVINRNTTYDKIKKSQKEILEKFDLEGNFQVKDIKEENGILISTHIIPEENKMFKIYHFIINANGDARKKIAQEARKKVKNNILEQKEKNKINEIEKAKETIKFISDKIENKVTFDDMIDILSKLKEVLYLEEANNVIKKFKQIGTTKRRKSTLVLNDKKYKNIQIFDGEETPIMGFCQKIRNEKNLSIIAMKIDKTIEQYKSLNQDNKYIIKKRYVKEAIKIANEKYRILELLEDKKIDIFISKKGSDDLRSYLYKDMFDEKFEIFIYADKDSIYTLLYQLGSILNLILCSIGETVPKEFIQVNKNIKIDLLKKSKAERKIIFSDIFAITALSNTYLEAFLPFTLKSDANKILEEYFAEAIGKKLDKK